MNEKPFTEKEQSIMKLLVSAHNEFMKLENTDQEVREWFSAFHNVQDIIGRKALRRDYPNYFSK